MTEMIERVALAMKKRAKEPLGNIKSLEPVLVGSLGDAWEYLANAAIEAMREPTEQMATHPMATCYNSGEYGDKEVRRIWRSMINAALDRSPQDIEGAK